MHILCKYITVALLSYPTLVLSELHSADQELFRLSLGCLQNMLMQCPGNVTRMIELGGRAKLTTMLESKKHDQRMEKCILKVLRNLPVPQL